MREELTGAFRASGLPVPADVLALGEPSRYGEVVVLEAEQLWGRMASPSSFVARIVVEATNAEEAVRRAREAIQAVYDFSATGIAHDMRTDAIVWSEASGWAKPSSTASGLAVGELMAARHASRVVGRWADELGAPLDADKLDLVRARALVRNSRVQPEVRLMRAFASLEALTPAGVRFDTVACQSWVRAILAEARMTLMHLINRVRDPINLGPLRDGATYADLKERVGALGGSMRWEEVLGAVDVVLEVVHPDTMEPILSRAIRRWFTASPVVRGRERVVRRRDQAGAALSESHDAWAPRKRPSPAADCGVSRRPDRA